MIHEKLTSKISIATLKRDLQKLNEDGLHIPAIVVTAFDDAHNREACRKYGVKAYMRKPVDGEALIDIIKYNQPHARRNN